jgi:hypothetical protein
MHYAAINAANEKQQPQPGGPTERHLGEGPENPTAYDVSTAFIRVRTRRARVQSTAGVRGVVGNPHRVPSGPLSKAGGGGGDSAAAL